MPTTPEGKAISSKNSLQHGCCSQVLIAPGETQAEFDELKDGWLADYEPSSDPALILVLEAVKSHWLLLRAQRWCNSVQAALYEKEQNPVLWTEEQHKSLERFARYRTAAERAFHRAFNDLEMLRKSRTREADLLRRAEDRAAALQLRRMSKSRKSGTGFEFSDHDLSKNEPTPDPEIRCLSPISALTEPRPPGAVAESPKEPPPPEQPFFTGKNAPKNQRKIVTLEQWVEITIDEHGNTVTELFPSNEELIKEGHTMFPPPELIYRRINFVDGVPPEYDWATAVVERRAAGGMGIQRMDVKTWLETIAREQAAGTGHIGPTGKPLPRPHERGECECPACTARYAGQT